MTDIYTKDLTEFAKFYFKNLFKGAVRVESEYFPCGCYSEINVMLYYNDIKIAYISTPIGDGCNTRDILNIFNEMSEDIKDKYKEELSSRANIFR